MQIFQVPDTNVMKCINYQHKERKKERRRGGAVPENALSAFFLIASHLNTVPRQANRKTIRTDPSVCVLLTDLSHITISMATGAVAIATASSQSFLHVRAVAVWVTISGSRQVTLTFTKVSPPLPPPPPPVAACLNVSPDVNKALHKNDPIFLHTCSGQTSSGCK